MAITLDAKLSFIQNGLNISSNRMQDYANKTVDEIIQAEANQGNAKAIAYAQQLKNDPKTFIETFKLQNAENKFNILSSLPENKLAELLPYLDQDDLVDGLNFFTQDKLLQMLEDVPIEQVANATLMLFPLNQIMEMMPDKALNKMFTSDDMDKEFMMKYIQMLPPEMLAAMIETATGELVMDLDPAKLTSKIGSMSKEDYQETLVSIPAELKRAMVMEMTKEEPKVMYLFQQEDYTAMLGILKKEDMMQGMIAIDKDELCKMNAELPPELISIVLTQMDSKDFAEMLIKNYPDILSRVVAV